MSKARKYTTPIHFREYAKECRMKLRLDVCTGCEFACKFCIYRKHVNSKLNKVLDYDKFEDFFVRSLKGELSSLESIAIENYYPIQLGANSDPFQFQKEWRYETGLKVVKLLIKHSYPFLLSTKSSLLLKEKYAWHLTRYDNWVLAVSVSSFDSAVEKSLTKASLKRRLQIIKYYGNRDVPIVLRIRPYIHVSMESFEKGLREICDCLCAVCYEFLRARYSNKYFLVTYKDLSLGKGASGLLSLCDDKPTSLSLGGAGAVIHELAQNRLLDTFKAGFKRAHTVFVKKRILDEFKNFISEIKSIVNECGLYFTTPMPMFSSFNDLVNCCGITRDMFKGECWDGVFK